MIARGADTSRNAGTEGHEFGAWFIAAAGFLTLAVGSTWIQVALWFSTDDHAFWVFVVLTGGIAAVIVTAFEVIAGVLSGSHSVDVDR